MLTQERLKELLHYDPDTGIFIWKKRTSNRIYPGKQAAACKTNLGYYKINIDGKRYLAHKLAWLYVYNYLPSEQIDHINQCRSDNRIVNLRLVTDREQRINSKVRTDSPTGITGVGIVSKDRRWKVNIGLGGNRKFVHLGYFSDFVEAVCHRLAAEQCLGWNLINQKSAAQIYIEEYVNGISS